MFPIMNNHSITYWGILFLLIGSGCSNVDLSSQQIMFSQEQKVAVTENAAEIEVDIIKSIIYWKGTKMLKTGKHEGTVNLKEGILVIDNGKLLGGYIIADMKSIKVTDMPPHETVPIKNLTTHLNSDFATDKYPTSKFEITQIKPVNDRFLQVWGDMTIRGVTKKIQVPIEIIVSNGQIRQCKITLTIDRFEWGIGNEGSWLEKKLVDDEFELKIEITIK